jgi:hypothetical protein
MNNPDYQNKTDEIKEGMVRGAITAARGQARQTFRNEAINDLKVAN